MKRSTLQTLCPLHGIVVKKERALVDVYGAANDHAKYPTIPQILPPALQISRAVDVRIGLLHYTNSVVKSAYCTVGNHETAIVGPNDGGSLPAPEG